MAQDWTDLDAIFTCPDSVTDDKLRAAYEVLVARARNDVDGVEISTGQLLQASLMIGWSVKHFSTSRHAYGDKLAYQHPGQEKDAVLALESICRDWNEMLFKQRVHRDRAPAVAGLPVEVVQRVLADALAKLPQEQRVGVLSEVASSLQAYTG